jgi:hypothetical protein
MTGIKEWNQESDKRRTSEELNPHFTGSMGLRGKEERRNNGICTLSSNSSWDG